jgi:hypothetical protein
MRWNTPEERNQRLRWTKPTKHFAWLPVTLEDGSKLWWEDYWYIERWQKSYDGVDADEHLVCRRTTNQKDFRYAE